MSQTAQTFKNHVRWFPPFHFFVLPALLINFLNAARHAWISPSTGTALAWLVAGALFMSAVLSRVMTTTVQDRVIRLEMRLRLRELLPPDLQGRIGELTRRQFVALRYAGDAELPDLMRKVLAGSLKSQKEIKMAVASWQGDHLRV